MRDREGHRERARERREEKEREREEGGRRGVITLATLTRRRPDSRSRSTRSTRSTRLRLTYTPTLGLPLHLLPSPSLSHPVPILLPPPVALHHPGELLFDLLPFFLFFVFLSCSRSPSLPPLLPRRARRGSSEFTPRSPNPKAPTPERERKRASCGASSEADFQRDAASRFSCGPSMNLSPLIRVHRPQSSRFALVYALVDVARFPSACGLECIPLPRTGAVSRGRFSDRRMNC